MKKVITALTATAAISTYGLANDASADTGNGTYSVIGGDSLWKIAQENNLTVNQLKNYNNLNSDTITVGQSINTHSPSTYTVKAGDTLWGIGNRNNVSVEQLKEWNNLSGDLILINQTLTLNGAVEEEVVEETEPVEVEVEASVEAVETEDVQVSTDTYTVKPGDTLYGIASKNGMTYRTLMSINGLSDYVIYPGDVLQLTGETQPVEVVAEEVEVEAEVEEPAVVVETEEPVTVEEEAPVVEAEVEPEEEVVVEEVPAVEEDTVVEEAPVQEEIVEEVEVDAEEPVVEEAPAEEVPVQEEVEEEASVEEVEVEPEEEVEEVEPAVEEDTVVEETPVQEEEIEVEAEEPVVEEEPAVEVVEEVEETETQPSNISGNTYTVQSGDTLASIANRAGMNYNDIMAFNEMDSVLIFPGKVLDLVDNRPAEVEEPEVAEEVSEPVQEETVEEEVEVEPAPEPTPAPEPVVETVVEVEPVVAEAPEPVVEEQAPATTPAASYGTNWYPDGECTWYAFERRKQMGKSVSGSWGDAKNWAGSASGQGLAVNNTPSQGAIMQSNTWSNGAYGYGHVAVVEHVNPDGSIMVSEMNWTNGLGGKSFRTLSASQAASHNFIH